ncbi:hypothetical protein BS50DRAFT_53725 [Corynespora cassiicola Philippines]|uniref:Uncharacterized protein n=1 Tax=Corynespora cassiicola Philippines TaxID=1448308 RepID=A0A2T2NJL1_CORCC|nr:hypothetical protein BS50DRAFT_53725 [Corynespora cassiicola Philippines]
MFSPYSSSRAVFFLVPIAGLLSLLSGLSAFESTYVPPVFASSTGSLHAATPGLDFPYESRYRSNRRWITPAMQVEGDPRGNISVGWGDRRNHAHAGDSPDHPQSCA